jgi:hypothetical protein
VRVDSYSLRSQTIRSKVRGMADRHFLRDSVWGFKAAHKSQGDRVGLPAHSPSLRVHPSAELLGNGDAGDSDARHLADGHLE